MDSTALHLLRFAVLLPSLAIAQTIQPVALPHSGQNPAIAAHSSVAAARSLTSSTSSRTKVSQSGYRSAISQDASPAPVFAGFYSAPFYPTAANPYESAASALLTGDFNGDGKPDVLTVNYLSGIDVLLNDGSGAFGNPISSQIGPTPGAQISYPAAYAVDLNGDGYTDVVLPTPAFQVAVLLNHKDATFPATTFLPLQNLNASLTTPATGTVAAGKTTANGGVDLVSVQSFTPSTPGPQTTILIETFLNDGTGNFPTQKTSSYTAPVPSTLQTNSIATLADVNQDGTLDLIVARNANGDANNGPLYVDVLLGNGDGTFQAPGANGTIAIAATNEAVYGYNLALANLTSGSSIPDIIVGTYAGVYVAKGNGDGTFQAATQGPDYLVPSIQIADVNGDGKPDLLIDGSGGVDTFLGNGDTTFSAIAGTAASGNPATSMVRQMVVADFNGDGKPDFAALNDENSSIEVATGNGDGTFHAAPVLYSASNPVLSPQQIYFKVAGDIFGNGTSWLIGSGNGAVVSASPNGAGGFNYTAALPSSILNFTYAPYPVTGDFNGDGKQDIILSGAANNFPAVAISNGDGTFQTPAGLTLGVTLNCPVENVAVGDVNGDGKLDLVAVYIGDFVCGNSGTVPSGYLVALGNGDGTFQTASFTPSGESLITLALAPYHGPGKPLDLVTTDEGIPPGSPSVVNPNVSFLSGNGDGTFGVPVVLYNGNQSTIFQVLTGDYNQDGKPDLTFFDASEIDATSGVLLYAGNGDGTFAAPVVLSSTGGASEGTYADLNNDGIPDLVFSGYAGLSVAIGTGGGGFATPVAYFAPPLVGPIVAGNFLGDNTQSIVASYAGSIFYKNQGGTILTVVPSPATITSGQTLNVSVQLQATVPAQPAPSGTITLYDGSTVLSSGPVSGFSFTTTQFAPGTHSLKATYSGDSHFYPNTSPTASVSVAAPAPAPDFSLTSSPASVTVTAGQAAAYQITVVANAALSGTITLQCSGLPAKAACALTPSTVTVAAGQSAGVALAISTQAATTALANPARYPWLPGSAAAILLFCSIPRRKRGAFGFSLLFCAVLLCSIASPLLGCGGGTPAKTPPTTTPGTPAGNATVTVTATASAGSTTITHASMITLVVQ